MKIQAFKTKIFKEGDDLIKFIIKSIPKLEERDIIVVTSKIVALSEGRVAELKSEADFEKIVKNESDFAIKTKYLWVTIKDGMLSANAGIDRSNANGKIILLPRDSFKSASNIRKSLMEHFKIKNLGVIISDSRTLPFRAGVVGISTGYRGFKGLRNYKGKKDLFGRKFNYERTDVVDSLTTSAVLLMGEGDECQPLAVIKDAYVIFTDKLNKKELYIDPEDDMYFPLNKGFGKQ